MTDKELRDSWCTPEWLIRAVLRAFERECFDLDPCANEWSKVPSTKRYTAADDGLAQGWGDGLVFCNPPYSQPLLRRFVEKCAAHRGIAVALIPFAPATEMWRDLIDGPGVLIPRLAFDPPPGIKASSPGPVPHALMLCGEGVDDIKLSGCREALHPDFVWHLRRELNQERKERVHWVIT